jgi:hypothetical protein
MMLSTSTTETDSEPALLSSFITVALPSMALDPQAHSVRDDCLKPAFSTGCDWGNVSVGNWRISARHPNE